MSCDLCDFNLSPYPASFGTVDPHTRLTNRRRDEIEARTAFYGESPWSLAHNLVADTIEQQLLSVNLGHLVTVVTVVTIPDSAMPEGGTGE